MKNNISALKTLFTTGLACAALQGSVSAETLINMDFNRERKSDYSTTVYGGATMTGAAVLGTSGDFWNSRVHSASGVTPPVLALNTSAGAVSGITLASTVTDSFWTHGQQNPPRTLNAGSAAQTLRYDWTRTATAGGTITMTLSGFNVGDTYELLLYGGQTGGKYTVGDDTRTIQGWGYTATGDVTDLTLDEGVDYTKYTGTIGAGGSLAFIVTDLTTVTGGGFDGDGLAGFQLKVVPAGYSSWATDNGFGPDPGAVGADGITNLVKYALGLNNPAASYPSPGNFSGNTLTFTKGAEAKADTNIVYAIDESTDLIIWTTPTGISPSGTVVNGADTITYTFPTGQTKVFARLKVIQNP